VHANEARAVVAATEVNAHLFWLLLFGREVFVEENLRLVWRERSNARHDAAVRFEKYILTRKTDYLCISFRETSRAIQASQTCIHNPNGKDTAVFQKFRRKGVTKEKKERELCARAARRAQNVGDVMSDVNS
jgi:hypothetical protein